MRNRTAKSQTSFHPMFSTPLLVIIDVLNADRVDFLCTSSMDGRMSLAALNYNNIEVALSLGEYPLYIYLHPQYANLRALLAKAMLELQQSGQMKKMIERAENKVIAAGAKR